MTPLLEAECPLVFSGILMDVGAGAGVDLVFVFALDSALDGAVDEEVEVEVGVWVEEDWD